MLQGARNTHAHSVNFNHAQSCDFEKARGVSILECQDCKKPAYFLANIDSHCW